MHTASISFPITDHSYSTKNHLTLPLDFPYFLAIHSGTFYPKTNCFPLAKDTMAQLVQMRSRIRAVETIEKVTHAMRLTAMSSHTKGLTQYQNARTYLGALKNITVRLHQTIGQSKLLPLLPLNTRGKELVILVGSQKGLCGNFNTVLYSFFEKQVKAGTINPHNSHFVGIGNKATEFLQTYLKQGVVSVARFSLATLAQPCDRLFRLIYGPERFKSIRIITNQRISFFAHQPIMHDLWEHFTLEPSSAQSMDELIWYQPATEVTCAVIRQYTHAALQLYLLESLLVEASTRFISMDNATRNARTILEDSHLAYNKLRQSIITKELTELAANL